MGSAQTYLQRIHIVSRTKAMAWDDVAFWIF
jgi:hypothetical protein